MVDSLCGIPISTKVNRPLWHPSLDIVPKAMSFLPETPITLKLVNKGP